MLQLDARFLTGQQMIDEDHRKIFATLNRIECELREGAGRPAILDLVAALEDYTETHFQREERAMACARCPMHGANCLAHRTFLTKIEQWIVKLSDSGLAETELLEFHADCSRWILNHIEQIDTALKDPSTSNGAITSQAS